MTKIDDEMVERAVQAYHGAYSPRASTSDVIRAALTAALSPKPEPEIEVTAEMIRSGSIAFNDSQSIVTAYRAMRALEPKPQEGAAYAAKSALQGVNAAAPVKETGGGVERKMRAYTVHSRKTDAPQENCSHVWPHRRRDD